jgi:hypothetical protein
VPKSEKNENYLPSARISTRQIGPLSSAGLKALDKEYEYFKKLDSLSDFKIVSKP